MMSATFAVRVAAIAQWENLPAGNLEARDRQCEQKPKPIESMVNFYCFSTTHAAARSRQSFGGISLLAPFLFVIARILLTHDGG